MTLDMLIPWVEQCSRRHAGCRASRDGREYNGTVPAHCQTAHGSGSGLSFPGPGRLPPCPPANGSACSLPGPCATVPPAFFMCWTSPPSAYIPPTWTDSWVWCEDLIDHGNSVVLVDHDARLLSARRIGFWRWALVPAPMAVNCSAPGTVQEVAQNPHSLIAPFLRDPKPARVRSEIPGDEMFLQGEIRLATAPLHTVHALDLSIPKGRLIAVTGVSGSGKTTLILESLIPALQAASAPGAASSSHPPGGRTGNSSGSFHRRHAHRYERALHRRHLQQCIR